MRHHNHGIDLRWPRYNPIVTHLTCREAFSAINSAWHRHPAVPRWLAWLVPLMILAVTLFATIGLHTTVFVVWREWDPTGAAFPDALFDGTRSMIMCVMMVFGFYMWYIPQWNIALERAHASRECLFCGYTLGVSEAERCPECGKSVVRAQQPAVASPSA